jgi:hypothetical protein
MTGRRVSGDAPADMHSGGADSWIVRHQHDARMSEKQRGWSRCKKHRSQDTNPYRKRAILLLGNDNRKGHHLGHVIGNRFTAQWLEGSLLTKLFLSTVHDFAPSRVSLRPLTDGRIRSGIRPSPTASAAPTRHITPGIQRTPKARRSFRPSRPQLSTQPPWLGGDFGDRRVQDVTLVARVAR